MGAFIPHSRPTLSFREATAVSQVVRSRYVSEGPEVAKFERAFARYQGQEGAVAVSSGTAALHLALLALGVGKGDEVIIPSYVCTALLNAVLYTQATPRVVDVHYEDGNMCAAAASKNITKKTRAMIVPHMFGQPADMRELAALGIPIIEDCAQSVGATYGGQRVGSLGALGVFSFYATKMMTTGEGGIITSGRQEWLERVRDAHDYDHKKTYRIRYNYKMTDVQAALGRTQLARLPEMVRRRKKIAEHYARMLSSEGVQLPVRVKGKDSVFFRYIMKVPKGRLKMIRYMENKGIRCAVPVFKPIHIYLGKKGFPNTERLMREAVSIPIYPSLTDRQVDHIAQSARGAIKKFA